ncbi:MAG: phage tail protein [Chloroflexi bacterium]|nr:phage tail protein [Chloroflexota bacterium]
MADDAVNSDPLGSFHFSLEVGPVTGYFTEVSGLGSESEVIDHKIMAEGAKSTIIRKIPGRLKWGDITLKRGITSNMDMWTWRKQVEDGDVASARTNGTITMYNQALEPKASWTFTAGWPSKITGPSIKSDANELGVEEITIVHEGIKRVT